MDGSALELYQEAYELHYERKKLDDAAEIYEKIIGAFPDADASAYSAIQLQKIRAQGLPRKARGGVGPVAVTLITVNLALLLIASAAIALILHKMNERLEKTTVITQVLGRMYAGRNTEAIAILDDMKVKIPNDITPFALAADVYRRNHEFLNARKEYEAYNRLYPGSPIPRVEIARINSEEDGYIRKMREVSVEEPELPQEIVEESDKQTVKPAPAPVRPRTRPPAGKKPKLLVDPEDIEYF